YANGMLFLLCVMNMSLFALLAAAAMLALAVAPRLLDIFPAAISIALAAVSMLSAEFFICYAFLRKKEHAAVAVNALTMLVILSGFAVIRLCHTVLTGDMALLLYAAGTTISATTAYAVSPLRLRRHQPAWRANIAESWFHGQWALGGVALTWLQSQAYTYLLAFYLGPIGIGQANAARIFISPFNFILTSVNKVAIPR